MSAVVERCPNCGVEHDPSHEGPCEVCGSVLGYWCRRHGAEIGWLSGPECPRCAREVEARRKAPRPAPPPSTPRLPRRDPHEVLRERAGEVLPHVATGAGLALRLVGALLVLVRTVILWGVLGGVVGAVAAPLVGGDPLWVGLFGASIGAAVGLFLGIILALGRLFARRGPR